MLDLEQPAVHYLLLLIGDNPLPNYVAARLLASPQTMIFLIYSEGTKTRIDALRDVLAGLSGEVTSVVPRNRICTIVVEESNAQHIADQVTAIAPKAGTIDLNYTGGTKAMATHAYAALERLRNDRIRVRYSYLDPRSLKLWLEDPATASKHTSDSPFLIKRSPRDANDDLALRLDTLLALHQRTLSSVKRMALLPMTAAAIAKLHADGEDKVWKRWIESTFFKSWPWPEGSSADPAREEIWRMWAFDNCLLKKIECGKWWKPDGQLKATPFLWDEQLVSVRDALLCDLDLQEAATWENVIEVAKARYPEYSSLFKKADRLGKWFEGMWLESYVLNEALGIASMCRLSDASASITTDGTTQFEFDVALVRGYQLFALSCTTSKERNLTKQKLLEAYARAEQLGGAEARVGLICFYPQHKTLEREILDLVGERRVRVFGQEDLMGIGEKLRDWIVRAT